MAVHGCIDASICMYMRVYARIWLYMAVDGCTWLYMAVGVQVSCSFSDGAALGLARTPSAAPSEVWNICVYIYIYIYIYACVYAYMCVWMRICACRCVYIWYMRVYVD